MTWSTAQLRRLSLLVLCVMLLGALAPTVSRARAWAQGGANWVEVCTSSGARQVAVDSRADDAPAQGTVMLDHCPLCVLATDRMAPPSTPFEWQALPQAPPSLARGPLVHIAASHPGSAQPRAPPANA